MRTIDNSLLHTIRGGDQLSAAAFSEMLLSGPDDWVLEESGRPHIEDFTQPVTFQYVPIKPIH